ncbi:flagellar export protein FliJ [Nitrosomonas sp.]|uniref:flagellar export protein FliJ n=1 Tax=Nitrosomonas sp. TaxID=42353 RepID=UPI001E17BEA3|nr:flagellar export protein FliJ [Nitrosomonas sp.]MBX3615704.1 flagellar export protein FliJ [Nitrosomonas sp.]
MPKPSSLRIMLDLAKQQADAAAKQLGKLNYQQQEAERKLQLLVQYRDSYQSQFKNTSKQGIDQIQWRNYIAFMNKLDTAITEQRQAVLYAQNKKNAGNNEFLSYQRKLKSYDTLVHRQQLSEIQRQIKNDQKLQDEFASNSTRHAPYPPKADS